MDYQSLSMKTVVELRGIAKDLGVKVPAGTKKNVLVELILEGSQRAEAEKKASAEKQAEKVADAPKVKAEIQAEKTADAPKIKAEKHTEKGADVPQAKAEKTAEASKAVEEAPDKPRRGRPRKTSSEEVKPVAEKKPADASKPAITPAKPAEASRPAPIPVKPAETPRPAPVPTKPAEAPRPTIIPVKPTEAPKPAPIPAKPGEAPRPAPVPAKPAETPRPAPEQSTSTGAPRFQPQQSYRAHHLTQGQPRQVQPRNSFQNRPASRPFNEEGRVNNRPNGEDNRPQPRFVRSEAAAPVNRDNSAQPRYSNPRVEARPAAPVPAGDAPQPQSEAVNADFENRRRPFNPDYRAVNPAVPEMIAAGECGDGAGVLEIQPDGYGFLRAENCLPGPNDVYISMAQIRRFNLRMGDHVAGKTRAQREGDRSGAMMYITAVNGEAPDKAAEHPRFEDLVPIYPNQRLRLEAPGSNDLSLRLIDMLAPIGKGQRGMIVSQPKAGKTTLLKKVANAITTQYPDVHLIVLLIDERPEEVTDMKRSINGEVIYSTFDEMPENHARVAEMVLARAQRLVETGKDVVVLMDSITRLARAYNLVITPTGRSLSGGLDPGALFKPKRFFGAARNIENGGSLTIIATALVETGSRMDDIIYEEFKGTGNMELHLDRKLSDRRVFPAIDMARSGTRREELLLSEAEMDGELQVRRMLSGKGPEMAEELIGLMAKTANNAEFFQRLKGWMSVYEKEGYK